MNERLLLAAALSLVLIAGASAQADLHVETDGLTATLTCEPEFEGMVFDWNTGDGTTMIDVLDETIEHTYPEAGTYGATCSAWALGEGSQTAWARVTVDGEVQEPPVEPPVECEDCQDAYTLSASKSYDPSTWTDDERVLCEEQALSIPETIEVVAGNAGNHWAFLQVDTTEGAATCFYQGGADQAHPGTPEQLALGEQWEFAGCYAGDDTAVPPAGDPLDVAAGDSLAVTAVSLSVNGDDEQGTTTGVVTLNNTVSCEEVPPEPPEEPTDNETEILVELDGLHATLTCDAPFDATSFDWSVNGVTYLDIENRTIEHTFSEPGRYDVSCSPWSRDDGTDFAWRLVTVEGGVDCVNCQGDYDLQASKSYDPSEWDDGELLLCEEQSFALPETLDVTTGNAGNHWSFLTIEDGAEVQTCFYQGGADQAHPASPEQLALGEQYHFAGCFAGTDTAVPPAGTDTNLTPGEVFDATAVTLSVNGDDEQGTTMVDLSLENKRSCEAPPQEECEDCQDAYTLSASKSYDPSTWTDDERVLCEEQALSIPETIEVVAGNAGNHWAFLQTQTGEDTTTCFYQGGADQAHPGTPEQLALGEQWEFAGCYAGDDTAVPPSGTPLNLSAGDALTTTSVLLSVNGDDEQGTTTGVVTLNNTLSCEDVPPVEPTDPAAELEVDSIEGLTATYTCDTTFDAMTYDWNFGDGAAHTDVMNATMTHTYAESGTYGVWCAGWRAGTGSWGDFEQVTVGAE